MRVLLVAAALVMQAGPLVLETRIDRTEALVGEEITLTLSITAAAAQPLTVGDPELSGLELVNRRDQTRVTTQGGARVRVTTRQLVLRAVRPGTAVVGRIPVAQGDAARETTPLTIRVTAPAADSPTALEPGVRRMVETLRAPTVRPDQATLLLAASTDTAQVGEQVDLLVTAWFPRALRSRLRTPPVMEPPPVQGAWIYHRPTPAGVVASRQVGGEWYDVYVLHDVVFPLTAGELEIGAATLGYTVPVAGAFLSREVRHEVGTEPRTIAVRPLPPSEPWTGFRGATGVDLGLQVRAEGTSLALGEATRVTAEVSGYGNVALWPEPEIEWPLGLHAYPLEVRLALGTVNGNVAGAKTFEYLVVADSAGTHRVPPLRYGVYDLRAKAFVSLTALGPTFVTPGGRPSVQPIRAVPRLRADEGAAFADRLTAPLRWWGWALVGIVPLLLAVVARAAAQRRHAAPRARGAAAPPGSVRGVEAELRSLLEGLVPEAAQHDAGRLAAALRAAGVEAPLAAHATRVRDRLRQARYGPAGGTDAEELAAEAQEVLRALGGGGSRRPAGRAAALVVLVLAAPHVGATQSPEHLYEAGAVRVAADSFAARAAAHPTVAAHWVNTAIARERLGHQAEAAAAWIRAARLAPRDPAVREGVRRTVIQSGSGTRVFPSLVTPAEGLLAAAVLWAGLWIAVAARARRRIVVVLGLLAAVAGAYGLRLRHDYQVPTGLAAFEGTAAREAPYGSARPAFTLTEGQVVRIERRWGHWVLVTRGGSRGWMLARDVVRI